VKASLIVAGILVTALCVGAQERPPNSIPPTNSETGSSMGKLNSKEKADKSSQTDHAEPQVLPCNQASPCYVVDELQRKTEEQEAKESSLDTLTRRYMWATIIGVVGAWMGLGVLIWQTIASRTSAQRQIRAYVGPEGATIGDGTTWDPPQPNVPGVVMFIKNFGQTPAYKVVSWAQIAVIAVKDENTMLIVPPMVEQFSTTVGSGASYNKISKLDRQLAPNEIADIAAGVRAIYWYGRIEYRDIFKRPRFTNFRLRYMGQYPPPANAILNFSEKGNDTN
jgi:hypothetical protein